MKVYYIGIKIDKIGSGGDKYVREVLCYFQENTDLIHLDFSNCDWSKKGVPFRLNLNAFTVALKANLWAIRKLREIEPKAIILMNPYNKGYFFIFVWLAKYFKGCRIVTIGNVLRQYTRETRLLNFIEKIMMFIFFTPTWIIIANSKMTKDELIRLGINKNKIKIVYPRVDLPPEPEEKISKDKDKFNLISVGYCEPYKELEVLIQALGRLKEPNIYLHIVGEKRDADYFSKLNRLILELEIKERVIFHGWLEGEALSRQYKMADILVNPCRAEGYGRVFVEAMHFGLPVIGANQGGAKELIINGTNGFLFRPGDAQDLAEKIKILHQDKRLCEEMSAQAIQISKKANFTENTGKQVSSIINQQLGILG
jgi:glycosyltransferase involved in cell wall biosynthesis